MGLEIERRFLVRWPRTAIDACAAPPLRIVQGYFGMVDGLRLRVRITSDAMGRERAFLTFKGARKGICRLEFEYPLAVGRARRALQTLAPGQTIRKQRYALTAPDGLAWSIDRFEDANQGLYLAEIELRHPGQAFQQPAWLGAEVTFDSRYGNSRLATAPLPRGLANAA